MRKFRIPGIYVPGFEAIAKLNTEKAQGIAQIITSCRVGEDEFVIAGKVAEETGLLLSDAQSILSTVFSLINLKVSRNEKTESLVKELAASYAEMTSKSLDAAGEKALAENLKLLLDADGSVRLTIKANYLQNEYEKVFEECRIITDIRPVYGETVEQPAEYALVVHQLRLTFTENDESKTVIIALDNKDLENLKKQIKRAIDKDTQIRTQQSPIGLAYIEFTK